MAKNLTRRRRPLAAYRNARGHVIWTDAMVADLQRLYPQRAWPSKRLAEHLSRLHRIDLGELDVTKAATRMGIRKPHVTRADRTPKWRDRPDAVAMLKRLAAEGLTTEAITAAINQALGTSFTVKAVKCYRRTCGATKHARNLYPKEIEEFLIDHHGLGYVKHLVNRLNRKFGTSYTQCQIESKLARMGVKAEDNQGLMTLAETARELGMNPSILRRCIIEKGYKTQKGGRHCFVPWETVEILRERYPRMSAPVLSTVDVGKRLGYCHNRINQMVRDGHLPAKKYGNRWKVPVAAVEAIEQQRRAAMRSNGAAKEALACG